MQQLLCAVPKIKKVQAFAGRRESEKSQLINIFLRARPLVT
jgi:hypothetical protein